jgi:hypothetical protein
MFEEKGREGNVVVDNVLFGSPAYMCGQIAKGDYIVAVDGMELHSSDAVVTALRGKQVPGTTVLIKVQSPDTVRRANNSGMGILIDPVLSRACCAALLTAQPPSCAPVAGVAQGGGIAARLNRRNCRQEENVRFVH